MNLLRVVLKENTSTTSIIDMFEGGYYNGILIEAYYSHRHNDKSYRVGLVIDKPEYYDIPCESLTMTTLKNDIRSLWLLGKLIKEGNHPQISRAGEILNFFDNHDVENFKEQIIKFANHYALNAQSSCDRYNIGFGSTTRFRIYGFVITDRNIIETSNGTFIWA